jgi:hypothetical protein
MAPEHHAPARGCAGEHRRRPGRLGVSMVLLATGLAAVAACTRSPDDDSAVPDAAPPVAASPVSSHDDPGLSDGHYRWSVLPIGAGGWATGLVLHPERPGSAFVRTDGAGAYRYLSGEERWEQLLTSDRFLDGRPEGTDYAVESLAVAPSDADVLYLAVGNDDPQPGDRITGTGRVLRSGDGGRTWRPSEQRWAISGNADHRQRSERLAVDPHDPAHVLLGTRYQGLWRSRDRGERWERVVEVPAGGAPLTTGPAAGVSFVEWGAGAHDTSVWVGVAGEGVFESTDAGRTWRPVLSEIEHGLAPFEGDQVGDHLVVALNAVADEVDGSLVRLDLSSGEWTDITPPGTSVEWAVAVSPDDGDRMIATTVAARDGELWRTEDGGRSWEGVSHELRSPDVPWLAELSDSMYVGRLRFDPVTPDRLWFAEGRGVWTADQVFDGSTIQWTSRMRGLEQTVTSDLVVPPGGAPISAVGDHQGFRHADLERYPVQQLVDSRFAGGTGLDVQPGHPQRIVWVGAEYHRYYYSGREGRGATSDDGGLTWQELPNLTADHFGGNVAISASDPDNLVWVPTHIHPWEFLDHPRGVFVTLDRGVTWTQVELEGSSRFHRLVFWFTRRALAADRVADATFYLFDDERNFWTSADGGVGWALAPHAPPCDESSACHVFGQLRAAPGSALEVWASTGSNGLHVTRDAGRTEWTRLPLVDEARAFDFGAPLAGSEHPTIYLHGRVDGDPDLGLWRSPDSGASWTLIAREPAGIYRGITVVSGDPDRPGRVYVGTHGAGFVFGDDPQELDR